VSINKIQSIKDVIVSTNCIGSKNRSAWGTDLEVTMHIKSKVDLEGAGKRTVFETDEKVAFLLEYSWEKGVNLPPH
jgi:hypothetical protein